MGKQHWVNSFEEVRDTEIRQAITRSRFQKVNPETKLAMLGYMIILTSTNEELEQKLDSLESKDARLAEYLKTENLDLADIRSTIGIKFSE